MVNALDEVFDHPYEFVDEASGVVMVSNVLSLHVAVTSPVGAGVANSDHSVVSLSSVHVVSYDAVEFDDGYGAVVGALAVALPDSATRLDDGTASDDTAVAVPPVLVGRLIVAFASLD
jgi:hypothetical protein